MELITTHPIKKSDLGFHGNLFGGKLFFGGKLINDEIKKGTRYKIISEKYNISQSQITSIKQKKTYKWLWI
jgi:hypothetical protein